MYILFFSRWCIDILVWTLVWFIHLIRSKLVEVFVFYLFRPRCPVFALIVFCFSLTTCYIRVIHYVEFSVALIQNYKRCAHCVCAFSIYIQFACYPCMFWRLSHSFISVDLWAKAYYMTLYCTVLCRAVPLCAVLFCCVFGQRDRMCVHLSFFRYISTSFSFYVL